LRIDSTGDEVSFKEFGTLHRKDSIVFAPSDVLLSATKAIGLSTAYIYKFFDSKQSIGEAVCALCLGERTSALEKIVAETCIEGRAESYVQTRRSHDPIV
jgi:hypothetical protein